MRRRKFLKFSLGGLVATFGGSTWWASQSNARAARYLRMMYADTKRSVQAPPHRPAPSTWSDNQITMSWLGHATVLINFYGVNILTDPTLAKRIGVSLGFGTVGPKRYIGPPLRIKDLPPIDVLLLSHAHMDHMDLPSLRRLNPNVFTVTAKLTSDILQDVRLRNINELSWGQTAHFKNKQGQLEIEAFEVKHWGRRWPSELARGYNGYMLRREGKSLLFAGDTAHTSLFLDLRAHGPFAAAMMPIGAYRPWIKNHCSPEEAVELANWARAQYLIPIHHQTFRLSEEPMNEPIERFSTALSSERERLALREVGATFVCPA
jgi:L-ascorbate metabolism protein UlaG (beta-lactamase superfamily)